MASAEVKTQTSPNKQPTYSAELTATQGPDGRDEAEEFTSELVEFDARRADVKQVWHLTELSLGSAPTHE